MIDRTQLQNEWVDTVHESTELDNDQKRMLAGFGRWMWTYPRTAEKERILDLVVELVALAQAARA